MKRQALLAMLSDKLKDGQLTVLDQLALEQHKTKEMVKVLSSLGVGPTVLLVPDGADAEVQRCTRNIPRVKMLSAALLNTLDLLNHRSLLMTLDLLNHRSLLMTLDAVRIAESMWGGPMVRRNRPGALAVDDDVNGGAAEEG
jgi:ribosomal protein L4